MQIEPSVVQLIMKEIHIVTFAPSANGNSGQLFHTSLLLVCSFLHRQLASSLREKIEHYVNVAVRYV